MNKKQLSIITKALSSLNGEQLQTVMRAGSMADFGFGSFVEKEIRRFDDKKKLVTKIVSVPRFSLHVDCHFRLSCGNEIILSRGDIFQPSITLLQDADFDFESFNWDVNGNNRYDEIVKKIFQTEPSSIKIKKVTISSLGDIKLYFTNDFLMEISPDISGSEECWRFFETGSEEHIVVSGQGLEEYEYESELED